MLENYLKVAARHLLRHKSYALINVAGLAIGLACCLFILGYVQHELRYDRFHDNAHRIARLTRPGSALSAGPMAPALVRELPAVEAAFRITGSLNVPVTRDDGAQFVDAVYAADSSIFDVFSLPLVRGDAATALRRPDALVISQAAARKYFGDGDPLGQTLTIQDDGPETFTVTGVMADLPDAAHFRIDLLCSFERVARASTRMENWRTNWLFTYLLLAEGVTAAQLQAQLPAFFERHTGEAWEHVRVQPLLDVHLHSAHLQYDIAPQGNIVYVYLFASVAVLVLLIACINFTNLATARALDRAREVGMRKTLGAHRGQLVGQFLGESMLLTLLALVLAGGLVSLLRPALQAATGHAFDFGAASAAAGPIVLGLVLLTGLLAGSYPAFVLAAFRPVETLKGRAASARRGHGLRRGLVVFQFTVSIFLIAATLAIYRQLDFLQNARLGFDKEQVLVLDFGDTLSDRFELVKREVGRHPNVRAVAAANNVPGKGVSDFIYRPEGWAEEDLPGWDTYFVDPDYAGVLDLEIVRGRRFSTEIASDTAGFLLNETAAAEIAAAMGAAWADPVGKQLDFYFPGPTGWEVLRSGPILGVVKDFHYRSLHSEIGPLVLQFFRPALDYLLVKVDTEGDLAGTLAFLEAQWEVLGPDAPFSYFFLDEAYDQLYRNEARIGQLFGLFSALAVLIACLGLFGLAAFTAERRTKEIGIRKVLGASVRDIVVMLSRGFAGLVVVAFVVAAPLAYLAVRWWLDAFAYRVAVPWGLFAVAGLGALLVALATVSYQAARAALADPVDALRYE
jgi:putative ABC transport system permease protein